MSTPQELKASERDTTLNPRQLRAAGFVPATIYGKNVESRSIQVRAHEFTQLTLQGNREFKLTGLGTEITARVQQIQVNPVTQKPLSIEFYQLSPAGTSEQPQKAKAQKQAAEKVEAQPEPETVLTGA